MKQTEKAALIAGLGGIAAGTLIAFAPVESPWWVPVLFGFFVAGGLHSGIIKNMAAERIADGDFTAKDKG